MNNLKIIIKYAAVSFLHFKKVFFPRQFSIIINETLDDKKITSHKIYCSDFTVLNFYGSKAFF